MEYADTNINIEFIDTLNIVIENTRKTEEDQQNKIKELESKIQNLEFQIETLKIKYINNCFIFIV